MTPQLTARYYRADGEAGSERPLPAELFDGVVHQAALHDAVTAHLANRRQGTASAKNRRVIRGGGRKPWRQKGTGRARVGSIRSPIWRGGAVVFPPQPRSYRKDLPRKVKLLARRSAINARATDGRVLLVEKFELERPKTRQLVRLLEKLGVQEEKVLILSSAHNPELHLSARNLPNVEVRAFGEESAYDVLWSSVVVIEEGALAGAASAEGARDASAEEAPDAEEASDA